VRSILRLFTFTRELYPSYLGVVVCGLLAAGGALITPFIIGSATDKIVAVVNKTLSMEAGVQAVVLLALAFLAIELAVTIATNIGGYIGDVMSERMRAILSSRYYEKLLQLPQRYFDDELTGTIVSRLDRTITQVADFVKSVSNNFFSMLVTTVAVLVITAFYSWPLAILIALLFPTYIWLTSLTSRRWQKIEHEKNRHVDAARGRFNEVVSQLPTVRSYAGERVEWEFFDDEFGQTVELSRKQSKFWHKMDSIRRGALNLVFAIVYAVLFIQTARGQYSIGEMVLLIQLVTMARQPVSMMSWLIDTTQHALAGSHDYFGVMALDPDPREGIELREVGAVREKMRLDPKQPPVAFNSVSFSYEPGARVLDDLSFEIDRGEKIALVSSSGGGKSTIVSTLLGFYTLDDGEIRLFGRNIADLRMPALRDQIGVVFQEPSLFSGTISENIAYARAGATEEEIIDAAKRANAWEFISRFPRGLETVIGERGLKLSGGQKQRIAVARAILKDAPVLILDEATSALDTRSEREVQKGLNELMLGRTSLIIAHRLSTIESVDRIITLDNGRIDEIGTPQALSRSGGIYARLLALQMEGSAVSREQLRDRYGILD
jgi:ATP-binding cassette subfamily B protein